MLHRKTFNEGCCTLLFNEQEPHRWLLCINVDDTLLLTPSLIETVVLYHALRGILQKDDSARIDHDIRATTTRGSHWGIIRALGVGPEKKPTVHICTAAISAFVQLARMEQVYEDLRAVMLQALGREPTLDDYLPWTMM